jgi:hypothetical protein
MTKEKSPNDPLKITISAKDLGALALANACPRCFWIKQKCKPLPYQIFPGIFSSIDAYVKKNVHACFDYYKKPPKWIPVFKDAFTYHKVPHWSKFWRTDRTTSIKLSGVMDDLLEQVNGSLIIPDYKTAKYTKTQDKLLPMYEAQLNGYGWIQDNLSDKPIAALYLIYCEPVTDREEETLEGRYHAGGVPWPVNKQNFYGFDMGFTVKTLPIKKDFSIVERLLVKAEIILKQPSPPAALEGCVDCKKLDHLTEIMGWF